MKDFYIITVGGRHGYEFGVHARFTDEFGVISLAEEYFDSPHDADSATARKMDEKDYGRLRDEIIYIE